jgi:predicted DNA binding CopG/RHH family protein
VSAATAVRPGETMPAKKKSASAAPTPGKQINFRASDQLAARIEAVAHRLGLDVSNFVRMVLNQNLPKYEEEVAKLPKSGA